MRKWPRRYREGGLAALPDLPRSGRPPVAPPGMLARIMGRLARARSMIADAAGVACHHSTVRRIMRASGLSPKVARLVHADRASRREVRAWRRRTMRIVRRLGRRGFTVVVQDEAIFVHDAVAGVKYWSPVGVPVDVTHAGSHARAVACGAIAEDGRRPFRTHGRFDAATFVECPRGLRRKFGRVAAVLDGAPQHGARAARECPRGCGGEAALIGLPVGSPYLSAVGEAWRRAKRAHLNPGHHPPARDFGAR
ncbi:MAG: helix-turn-helix domain-containing protein [Thaumarchaeota archaeon]|nr:helix-turn-helix domain-containing protein [Nitrososphaerota archaeon]